MRETTAKGDREALIEWHENLSEPAERIGQLIVRHSDFLDVHTTLRQYMWSNELRAFFGGPSDAYPVSSGSKVFDEWFFKLWGRRCSFYITQLRIGLERSGSCSWLTRASNLREISQSLGQIETKLRTDFSYSSHPRMSRVESLRERRDIANFLVTYIDPILFSSLHWYERDRNNLDSHSADENPDHMVTLRKLIAEEVGKYSDDGSEINNTVADASNLWWGLRIMIGENGENFKLGDHEGYEGAARVLMNFVNSGRQKYPPSELTWTEATPEIHGETKTKLWIAINCVKILEALGEYLSRSELNRVRAFISHQLLSCVNAEVRSHIYLLGVALQACEAFIAFESQPFSSGGRPANVREGADERRRLASDSGEGSGTAGTRPFLGRGVVNGTVLGPVDLPADLESYLRKNSIDLLVDERSERLYFLKELSGGAERQTQMIEDLTPQSARIMYHVLRDSNRDWISHETWQQMIGIRRRGNVGSDFVIDSVVSDAVSKALGRFKARLPAYLRDLVFTTRNRQTKVNRTRWSYYWITNGADTTTSKLYQRAFGNPDETQNA